MEEPYIALLDKVEDIEVGIIIAHSDLDHQPKVGYSESLNRIKILIFVDDSGNLPFLFPGKQGVFCHPCDVFSLRYHA